MSIDALTVGGLLATPRWAHQPVLAGDGGLRRTIGDVQIVRDIGFAGARPAALVVVLIPPETLDWRIDAAVRRLVDVGSGALVLPTDTPLAAATTALAARLAMPVIGCADDPLELAGLARDLLAAPETVRARLVLAANQALSEADAEYGRVLEILSDLLVAKAAVVNAARVIIEGSCLLPARLPLDRRLPTRCVFDGVTTIACPVPDATGDSTDSWLVVSTAVDQDSWERGVTDVLRLAAGAVQRWRAVRRVEIERDARVRATLLGEILRLQDPPTLFLRRRAADAGWSLDGWHVGFHVNSRQGTDSVALTSDVAGLLRIVAANVVVVEHAEGCSGWHTSATKPTAAQTQEFAVSLRSCQRRLRGGADTALGVSRPYQGPQGIARTLGEAVDAARLAGGRPETGYFMHVDRMGSAQLLLAWTHTDSFRPSAQELLAPLLEHPVELRRTLLAYLDAQSSLVETAAVLGVHRNTVAGRIAKVQEVLDIDLTDPDQRLGLHLACRAVLDEGEPSVGERRRHRL